MNARESNILHRAINPHLLKAVADVDGFLAGGAVRSVFTSEPIKDFDFFFPSRTAFDTCLEELRINDKSPTFSTTDTAWTHVDDDGDCYQFICASFGTPESVIRRFDFTCCMGAWNPKSEEFLLDPLFLKHCSQRRLIFNVATEYPICSLWRAFKFVKRGWKLPATEAIKMALRIHDLNISDRAELKRQLLGIDTLFLKELTDALAEGGELKYDFLEAIKMVGDLADQKEVQS